MWNVNLTSLAQKAKEAAARLESQLDDSIGIADDSLFGKTSATKQTTLETMQEHDVLNMSDDFFSDHHEAAAKEREPNVTKLDVTTEENDDFFSDGPGGLEQTQEEEEEVDFGRGEDDGPDAENEIASNNDVQQQVQIADRSSETVTNDDISMVKETPNGVGETSNLTDTHQDLSSDEFVQPEPALIEEGSMQNEITCNFSQETTDNVAIEPEALIATVAVKDQSVYEQKTNFVTERSEPLEVSPIEQQTSDLIAEIEPLRQDLHDNIDEHVLPIEESPQSHIQQDVVDSSSPIMSAKMDETEKMQLLETISQLKAQILQREEQLASKSDQITSLTIQHDAESTKLRQSISETKEEAKKRILKAKERVEEMQTKLSDAMKRADSVGDSSGEQSEIIAALRAEGEQLARKQSQMEQSVRSAKTEARELAEQLQVQTGAKETALQKISSLEQDIKSLKDELSSARKGESQSKKLEGVLVAAKEESEKQRAINLGLEQQLKELKDENKTLKKEAEDAKAGAAIESERESNKLRKERDDMLGDLESKLRTSEREANVREDALRHEVTELRKRWQDAVRRAENLSMDVQDSTAPLLRQLESTERQNRARASAWAELETKLRADLEENLIQLEKVKKERNDLRASDKRSQRILTEKENEIASLQETIKSLSSTIESLEGKIEKLQDEKNTIKIEKEKNEKQASESVAKVRNELMKSMIKSEETYRSQIEALEAEVADEKLKRDTLVKQLDNLAENVNTVEFSQTSEVSMDKQYSSEQEKKLRATTNQASILHDTLLGIDSDNDEEEDDDEVHNIQGGSFAAMEQLSQGLKAAKTELVTLRTQLASSEESREKLVIELAEMRQAAEKLPLFESKVSELTMEVNLKDMEIKGLQDDISDVRFLYRQQLDTLLEEKAAEPKATTSLEKEDRQTIFIDNT